MTATTDSTFTAAQFNAHIRDNLLETAPAKASEADGYFVSTAANTLAERHTASERVDTRQSRSFSSYGPLVTSGPEVTVTTGPHAIVIINASMQNTSSTGFSAASFEVSGATSVSASDAWCCSMNGITRPITHTFDSHVRRMSARRVALSAGSNTFTMMYRASGGTAWFHNREIIVIPL